MTELAATTHCNDAGQRFQNVAKALGFDPQAVTLRRVQGFEMPSLADQPSTPAVEFTSATGFQRLGALAAGGPLPTRQPWPMLDPT
jgi:hypothetical protein